MPAQIPQMMTPAARAMSSATTLSERLHQLVPEKQAEMKDLKAKYSDKSLGEVTVGQVRHCL